LGCKMKWAWSRRAENGRTEEEKKCCSKKERENKNVYQTSHVKMGSGGKRVLIGGSFGKEIFRRKQKKKKKKKKTQAERMLQRKGPLENIKRIKGKKSR